MTSFNAARPLLRHVSASSSTARLAHCACWKSSGTRRNFATGYRYFTSTSEPKQAEAPTAASTTDAGPSAGEPPVGASRVGYGPPAGIVSACPEGTVLKGLGLLKDQPEPIALPDSSYPTWLWSLAGTTGGGSDVSSTGAASTKGEIRMALKRAKKAKRLADAKASKTPGQAAREEAPKTSEEIKRQLRKKNRERIKAANFVKAA